MIMIILIIIIIIIGIYRCMGIRRMFLSQRWAANTIQRLVRGMFARIRVQEVRELRAVVIIQTSYRSHLHYDRYLRLKTVIIIGINNILILQISILILILITAQSYFRGLKARKEAKALKYNIWSLRLQRIFIGGINRYYHHFYHHYYYYHHHHHYHLIE